jgi:hypothetical protein
MYLNVQHSLHDLPLDTTLYGEDLLIHKCTCRCSARADRVEVLPVGSAPSQPTADDCIEALQVPLPSTYEPQACDDVRCLCLHAVCMLIAACSLNRA